MARRKPRPKRPDYQPPAKPAVAEDAKPKPPPSPEAMARARARLAPPPPPWAPLPLAELGILLGAVIMAIAAFRSIANGVVAGFLLVLLGTGEFSLREHRHGYRSHSTLLAAVAGLTVALVLWFWVGLHRNLSIGLGIFVFLAVWNQLYRNYESQ